MRITLCGSARFEGEFKRLNEELTLRGHVVYSLAVFPSDKAAGKNWYTPVEKRMLDHVHFLKINNSDAIYVIAGARPAENYIGESTSREIAHAITTRKGLFCAPGFAAILGPEFIEFLI